MNSNVLKKLYLYRNGENKGFLALLRKNKNDKDYEREFQNLMNHALILKDDTLSLINELHAICSDKYVDDDVANLVNQLYYSFNGGD